MNTSLFIIELYADLEAELGAEHPICQRIDRHLKARETNLFLRDIAGERKLPMRKRFVKRFNESRVGRWWNS